MLFFFQVRLLASKGARVTPRWSLAILVQEVVKVNFVLSRHLCSKEKKIENRGATVSFVNAVSTATRLSPSHARRPVTSLSLPEEARVARTGRRVLEEVFRSVLASLGRHPPQQVEPAATRRALSGEARPGHPASALCALVAQALTLASPVSSCRPLLSLLGCVSLKRRCKTRVLSFDPLRKKLPRHRLCTARRAMDLQHSGN